MQEDCSTTVIPEPQEYQFPLEPWAALQAVAACEPVAPGHRIAGTREPWQISVPEHQGDCARRPLASLSSMDGPLRIHSMCREKSEPGSEEPEPCHPPPAPALHSAPQTSRSHPKLSVSGSPEPAAELSQTRLALGLCGGSDQPCTSWGAG